MFCSMDSRFILPAELLRFEAKDPENKFLTHTIPVVL
jgi:hypothetical protein